MKFNLEENYNQELLDLFDDESFNIKPRLRRRLLSIVVTLMRFRGLGIITQGEIDLNIETHLTASASLDLTVEEYNYLQSMIKLRKDINSPYEDPIEMMEFIINNKENEHLLDFDSIIHNSQRLKGELSIEQNKLQLKIDLKKLIRTTHNKG